MATTLDDFEGGRRRRRYDSCCAWTSFIIWFVVIFLIIIGICFFAFVRSNLPQINVHRLDVYKLNVTDPSKNGNKDTKLTVDMQILVNVTNKNKKVELVYGGLNVDTMIEGFSLPKVHVAGFRQKPESWKDLKIHPQETRSMVNPEDAKELKWESDRNEMEIDMNMKGKIEFWYKGRMLSQLRLKVLCSDIEQAQVDEALASPCNVKLSPFRSFPGKGEDHSTRDRYRLHASKADGNLPPSFAVLANHLSRWWRLSGWTLLLKLNLSLRFPFGVRGPFKK